MSEAVKIVEVGPRDGLQNEKTNLSVLDRIEFIQKLEGAGIKFLEGGSFVSPKAIPQMIDSDKVWTKFKNSKADLSFLVPNEKGYPKTSRKRIFRALQKTWE
jgi:hydroxymethylglutaryl-CoA lyase